MTYISQKLARDVQSTLRFHQFSWCFTIKLTRTQERQKAHKRQEIVNNKWSNCKPFN